MDAWTPPRPTAMRVAPTTKPGVEMPVSISEGKEVAKRAADPTA